MPDRIVGQATPCVMRNSGGFVRVVFPPWGLDIGWYDQIAVGHWIGNVTVAATSQITAKGGTEFQGFWFDTAEVWLGTAWANNDRCSPIRQVGLLQHNTFALAVAAAANNDWLLVWFRNVANSRTFNENVAWAGKGGSVWGMLSRRQCTIGTVQYTLNLLGQNVQAWVANLTARGDNTIYYNPAVGQAGAGLVVSRCFTLNNGVGGGSGPRIGANATANTCEIHNCINTTRGRGSSGVATLVAALVCHCTGFAQGFSLILGGVYRNLLCIHAVLGGDFAGTGLATILNSVGTDGSLPVDPTNQSNQTVAQIAMFFDTAGPGNKMFPLDFRVHNDSVCRGAGTPIAGVAYDMDYQPRSAIAPTVGAHEGSPVAYAPAADIIRGHILRGTNP